MNIYSKKQRWKIVLSILALLIVGAILWYTGFIANKVRKEERQKVKLWSEAIQKKADLVKVTNMSFDELANQERKKVELWAKATKELQKDLNDYSFALEIIQGNQDIPLILTDENNKVTSSVNLPEKNTTPVEDLIVEWEEQNPPIEIKYGGNKSQKIYFRNSETYYELQKRRDSLILSFNEDLVENVALVPVLFIKSQDSSIIASNLPSVELDTKEKLESVMQSMKSDNEPITVNLNLNHTGVIYFHDSNTLQQLEYFPYIIISIISIFLVIGYLLFSTFRRAEQNQVWVGMAKETAHQLGTPLSSLMAWTQLLEAEGVNPNTINEMNKDLFRLETITDRFSKIGSESKKEELDLIQIVKNSINYLRSRISNKVEITFQTDLQKANANINKPLFEWVIENLVKNAVDAMEGEGKINITLTQENNLNIIEVCDTGKGIPTSRFKTVFEPGFTTKKRGWGLGLSLAKRIIEEHHKGKIYVKSSSKNGTTFRIEL